MTDNKDLIRFLEAQNLLYLKALEEIKNGQKETHWMWFIFPQIKGLGFSDNVKFYGIADLQEATAYLAHPILGKHLIEISEALLKIEGKSATQIFGNPDDVKLRASMTLFSKVTANNSVFDRVIKKFFDDIWDEYTLEILEKINDQIAIR